ncbi:MAG: hypothetical protein Q7T33_02650 [Dehalococcoidia bacterium]|nr:hypothetical protein [Dehalococcoidia bacterium]
MAGIFATAGSKLYIGNALASKSTNFVLGDFVGQSWVEVGWLETIGAFGDESSEVSFDAIGEGRTQKLKGVRNAGNMDVVCGIDYEDEGQIELRAAEGLPNDFAFKVEFNDAPAGGTPSERYFIAKVMGAREALDGANNVMKLNSTLGVNSNIVRVNAAA